MLLTAQYNNHMRIGQGFNSYTHETRIDNAVLVGKERPKPKKRQSRFRDSAIVMEEPPPPQALADDEVDQETRDLDPVFETEDEATHLINSKRSSTDAKGNKRASQIASASHKGEAHTKRDSAISPNTATAPSPAPFHLLRPDVWDSNQSVTYSSWQIDHVSEIADAMNISSYALVKYATVEANANASMIHESRVHDSQLNYMVSVKVNNDSTETQENTEFQPIEGLPPERFTQVYGDCFISGFLEGGDLQAVISIKVNDRNKLQQIKEAVDCRLSVPAAPGLQVGAGNSVDNSSRKLFENTETTISVKSNGGGVIKAPGAKWNLDTVIAIANAFPSMVAACPNVEVADRFKNRSKTAAMLTRYQSLKSFQEWKWRMVSNPTWSTFISKDDHWESRLIYNYAPCKVYVNALFEDLMAFKAMQRKIKDIIENPTHYRARDPPVGDPNDSNKHDSAMTPDTATVASPVSATGLPQSDHPRRRPTIQMKRSISRGNTFSLEDPDNPASYDLRDIDSAGSPLAVDVAAMKKAKLCCRAAVTLITEEAARLVDHPGLAYAEFDDARRCILINRANYPVPELLARRLPIFVGDDASEDTLSHDPPTLLTRAHARASDLYFNIVGDAPSPLRRYRPFCTLDASDTSRSARLNRITRLSLHAYRHSPLKLSTSSFSRDAHGAIGALGMSFAAPNDASGKRRAPDGSRHLFGGRGASPGPDLQSADLSAAVGGDGGAADITKIEIAYVPGTGRIAGLTFYEGRAGLNREAMPVLRWAQWEYADGEGGGREPEGLKRVVQSPPVDGGRWVFVGLAGGWDEFGWGGVCGGKVLGRVSGIWRRV